MAKSRMSYIHKRSCTTIVENGNDIVTKLPFSFMGYRHIGAKLHIGSPRFPLIFSANNHYPHEYYSAFLNKFMP